MFSLIGQGLSPEAGDVIGQPVQISPVIRAASLGYLAGAFRIYRNAALITQSGAAQVAAFAARYIAAAAVGA
ncbi:MAG TPA: hypothetical protein VIX86_19180, partial [Streptosporangiaceae bacterium]